jgi:hypothetical protein
MHLTTFEMISTPSTPRDARPRPPSLILFSLDFIMHTFLAIVAAVLATVALAQDKFEVVLTDMTDAKGSRVQFHTDTEALARTPEWNPGSQDPPLTVVTATRIAIEAGKRRLPKADDIAVNSITLRKSESYGRSAGGLGRLVRWYYEFTVSPIMGGETFHGSSATTLVILLDGSVIEPSPVK